MIGTEKRLVLVAGPNGSGKTTLVRSGALSTWLDVPTTSINADDVAREMACGGTPDDMQSLAAARHCDAWLDRCIETGNSVIVESVLSSEKLRPRVEAAQAAGFMVILVFVTVRTAEHNVGRVAQRVRLGGHPVPVDRIVRRRQASHGNFLWFALRSDIVLVFDNTDKPTLAYGRMRDTNSLAFTELCGAMHFLPDDMRIEITRLRGIDR